MGPIANGGVRVLNEALIREFRIAANEVARVATAEADELQRRERAYRGDRGPVEVSA